MQAFSVDWDAILDTKLLWAGRLCASESTAEFIYASAPVTLTSSLQLPVQKEDVDLDIEALSYSYSHTHTHTHTQEEWCVVLVSPCFYAKKSKNGECVELLCTRNILKHTQLCFPAAKDTQSPSFIVKIELKTAIKHTSSPIIFCRWWRDSVSPPMHGTIVKLMEKSVGVKLFTHIKLPSLQKLSTFPASSFLDLEWEKGLKECIFLETNQ